MTEKKPIAQAVERGIIILVGHTKGGAHKSTMVENIGVEIKRLGYDVAFIDADDRQRTLSKWCKRRNESIENGASYSYIPCFNKDGKFHVDTIELAKKYDFIIIDAAGRESAELRSALQAADIVYVPMQPTQNDMESMQELAVILDETEDNNPTRKVIGMIAGVPHYATSTAKQKGLKFIRRWHEYMGTSRQTTTWLESYRQAPENGASVIDLPSRKGASKAKAEIQLLVQEILSHV